MPDAGIVARPALPDAAPPFRMDLSIAGILLLDGVTNGAVYGLLALALGAGVRGHARHLHSAGRVRRLRRADAGAAAARQGAGDDLAAARARGGRGAARSRRRASGAACRRRRWRAASSARWSAPVVVAALTWWAAPLKLHLLAQSALTLAIVTLLGPLVYRLAYQRARRRERARAADRLGRRPLRADRPRPVFFGAEGYRNPSFWDARFSAGALTLSGQTIFIFVASIALIVGALALLRPHAARQGAARDRGQPRSARG